MQIFQFIKDSLGLDKNAREIDEINQAVTDWPWFIHYTGHNPDDISIRYSCYTKLISIIHFSGGLVGLIGGVLGIMAFFNT